METLKNVQTDKRQISYKEIAVNSVNPNRDFLEKEVKNEWCCNPYRKPIITVFGTFSLIVIYLSLSICLTFYQKWVLKELRYPLTIVMYHLVCKFFLASLTRIFLRNMLTKNITYIDIKTSFKKIAPTGIASGIDIGFSNWGLELVTVSLYTMTKSTTIIFILFFAILLGLEKKKYSLFAIVGLIAGGLFMFTYKSTSFDLFGFSFLLFASMASGVRWSFCQKIMQNSKLGLQSPIEMMFYMQPWMFLSILPFVLGFEAPRLWISYQSLKLTTFFYVLEKISLGGLIAFTMEVMEYLVLSYTSSLTLSITGIFKEICQLVLAVYINGDKLSFFNIIGLALCLCGICCHAVQKYIQILKCKTSIDVNDVCNSTTFCNKKNMTQKIPLLSDSAIDSDSDDYIPKTVANSSEIVFDILKNKEFKT